MATFEIENFNFNEYYEKPCEEYLKPMFFNECCKNKNALLNKKNFPATCDKIADNE